MYESAGNSSLWWICPIQPLYPKGYVAFALQAVQVMGDKLDFHMRLRSPKDRLRFLLSLVHTNCWHLVTYSAESIQL